jgi:hypothetical protein
VVDGAVLQQAWFDCVRIARCRFAKVLNRPLQVCASRRADDDERNRIEQPKPIFLILYTPQLATARYFRALRTRVDVDNHDFAKTKQR